LAGCAGAVLVVALSIGLPSPAGAIAPVAVLVLLAVAPLLMEPFRRNMWCAPLLAALAFMVADPAGVIAHNSTLSYLPVIAVILIAIAARKGVRDHTPARVVVGVLAIVGTLGALVGRFQLGVQEGALPLLLPALVAVVPFSSDRYPFRNPRVVAIWISILGSAVTLVAGLARSGVAGFDVFAVNHEQAFIAVLAIGAAFVSRSILTAVIAVGAGAYAFAAYPAATYIVAAAAGLATLVVAPALRTEPARRLAGAIAVVAVPIVSTNLQSIIVWFGPYFVAVNKVDNGSTRLQLEHAALARLADPLFGTFFTGPVTVAGNLGGQEVVVPVHNDYLSLMLSGGYVGLVLLVGFLVLVNGRVFRASLTGTERGLSLALLAALNAAAASSFANPVLMKPSSTIVVFAIAAVLLAMTHAPTTSRPSAHQSRERASDGLARSFGPP
jgi:hypothetical protein